MLSSPTRHSLHVGEETIMSKGSTSLPMSIPLCLPSHDCPRIEIRISERLMGYCLPRLRGHGKSHLVRGQPWLVHRMQGGVHHVRGCALRSTDFLSNFIEWVEYNKMIGLSIQSLLLALWNCQFWIDQWNTTSHFHNQSRKFVEPTPQMYYHT